MLMILACLFPMIAGVVISAVGMEKSRRHRLYALAVIVTDVLILGAMLTGGKITLVRFFKDVTLTFSVDAISRYVLSAVILLFTCVLFYAFEYMEHEEHEERFFAFFMISMGALTSVCMAGNLVTLYFCFEMLTLMSMPLVIHEMTKDAVTAALKYLYYSIGGALMGLLAVFFIYYYSSGDGSFVLGGFLDPAKTAGHEKLLLAIIMVGIIGFGTKAGLYPMHGWLPTAHPIAPAPASALLSGIIVKAGVVALIRLVFYSVGAEFIRGTWVQYTWMTLAMLTIFMGSMMAFREKVMKKRLAYSTISQLSYILLGLSFLAPEGVEGGLLHLVSHTASKGCLFLCAGAFICKLGIRKVSDLKGIGKRMPITLGCFTVASLSLVGIPPLGGFLSKWVIASAAISSGIKGFSFAAPVILLISALLTAGYLLPVVVDGFFPGREEGEEESAAMNAEPSIRMTIPMVILCCAALIMGIFGSSIVGSLGLVF